MALTKATLIDLNSNELVLDLDADTSITADTDDTIHFKIAGSDEITMTTTALAPSTSDGQALGTSSLMFADLFLASGSVVNFNNGDVTLTHSSNTLTLGGGALDVDGGITVDNITIDGTEIDLSSGDLTIDVAGDIILDADGGDILIKDAGTTIGEINMASSNLSFTNSVQDKDILFKGNDGGSVITALTIDMSAGGALLALSEGKAATTNITQGAVKVWNRTQDGSNISTDSFNVSGTTDNAAGDYDIQIANNMGNANYIVVTGADDKQDGNRVFASMVDQAQGLATTAYEIVFKGVANGQNITKTDPNTMSASAVLGDLA